MAPLPLLTGLTYFLKPTEKPSILLPISRDVVLGPWSLVVLKDRIVVHGPGLGFAAHFLLTSLVVRMSVHVMTANGVWSLRSVFEDRNDQGPK